jgi:hypothetical protein
MRANLHRPAFFVLALSVFVACSSEPSDGNDAVSEAPASGQATAMPAMHEDTLAQRMETHLATVDRADAQQLKALVPEHRRMVTGMIEDCRQMMRQMNMSPPAKWTELENALMQDLDRMDQLPAEQIQAFLPEHRQRVQSMVDMRHEMM